MISLSARLAALALTLTLVGGCFGDSDGMAKHLKPLGASTKAELRAKGMRQEDPLLIRIFKEESELEVWKKRADGRYALFRTYEICAWSGELGPKRREGDRQAPEGFYTVTPAQMNPNSSYHLSFNIGFPNTFDRAHGRTGRHLMVHGACSSAGCYAMTDDTIQEIYSLARESFRGGQREFQVQAYPFRMTPENMARHADNPNMAFWRNLKHGSDHFEVTGRAPEIGVCNRQYVFNARAADGRARLDPSAPCPYLVVPDDIEQAVASRQMRDEVSFQLALAELRGQPQQAATALAAGGPVVEEGSSDDAPVAVAAADQALTTGSIPRRPDLGLGTVTGAVTGMFGRVMDFTRGGVLGRPASAAGGQPEEASLDVEAAPAEAAAGPSASAAGVPSALRSAFAPPAYAPDPFAVFALFESVEGVSVPVDTIRRK